MPETKNDAPSIVGDECHIISPKPKGPRSHQKLLPKEYDKFANLLLLCKPHHKLIDDQESTFTIALLRKIKADHERCVFRSKAATQFGGK